jgi:lipopolysaccharide/colanic/teichoic acid biosynthesis glycosyltransferase
MSVPDHSSSHVFATAALPDRAQHEMSVSSFLDAQCRALDLLLAVPLLVLLSPFMLLIALVVKLDSPGPAIFSQRRCGRSLRAFTLHKFRTMTVGAPNQVHRAYVEALIAGAQPEHTGPGPRFKLIDDPRVTRIGHWLRRTSLDELPQLWNVLRGEMSLVGPRPALDYEVAKYQPAWLRRFAVKPGMTGIWQVSGRSNLTHEEMIELDLSYVARRSIGLNTSILLRTIPVVLGAEGTS